MGRSRNEAKAGKEEEIGTEEGRHKDGNGEESAKEKNQRERQKDLQGALMERALFNPGCPQETNSIASLLFV